MNYLLLLLAACSSPVSTEKAKSEPAPTPASQAIVDVLPLAEPPRTLAEVQAHKVRVEASMRKVIDRAKAFPGSNPDAVSQAEDALALLRDHFYAVTVKQTDEGLQVTDMAPTCTIDPCLAYTVADVRTGVVAAYDSHMRAIAFSPSIPTDDPYAPYVMFHELSHTMDHLNGITNAEGTIDTPVIVGTPNPSETQAYAFEAEMLNGATHGKYFTFALATGQMIMDKKLASITVEPGPVTFFDFPNDTYGMIEGGATMSEVGRQSMELTFSLSVNRLLMQAYVTPADMETHQTTLYNDLMSATTAAQVQDFIRQHRAQ